MRNSIRCLLLLTAWVLVCGSAVAEGEKKPSGFVEAVISKSISFMPEELKVKFLAAEKEIVTEARRGTSLEAVYYVATSEGSGPSLIADKFRLIRKDVSDGVSFSKLVPNLGALAGYVIALSQPYHTDEAAFKDDARPAFEKSLDSSVGSLKADFDGYQSVDVPTGFAVQLAKDANGLLKKQKSSDSAEVAGVPSAIFAQASNRLADCWWTLLNKTATTSSSAQITPAAEETYNYVGNTRTMKFHCSWCKYLPAEHNRAYFKTRDEAIYQGFIPCKVCKP